MGEVFDCTDDDGRTAGVEAAVRAVRDGEVIVLPTDTVYGVGADAFNADAVSAVLAAKGRGRDMPPPVLVANPETVDGLARDVPGYARALIERFWPGPLTLVLQAQPSLAWDLGETGGTVALRMPQDPTALALLAQTGPLAVTSANRTGHQPATTAIGAAAQLGAAVSVYLDGGPAPAQALASTILDCTGTGPVTLRVGGIDQDEIDRIVTEVREREYAERVARGDFDEPDGDSDDPDNPDGANEADEADGSDAVAGVVAGDDGPHDPDRVAAHPFYGSDYAALRAFDPQIADVLLGELDRLRSGLQLIASENLTSPAVLTALGSTLSNKYAEGYPGRRYYGGCAQVDIAEELAIERCTSLFHAQHANVQPHSGASANQAVYGAFLKPGDTLLGMSLPMGGHLTHGASVSFSGAWFNAVGYGVDRETEDIDYDEVERLAKAHRPKVILAGGSAIPRLIDYARFRAIADEVGAIFWVDAAHFIGLVAGRSIPSPVPLADVVSFTTHKVLRGPRSGAIVCRSEHAAAIDKAVFPMMQGGPQMRTIAAKAVNFKECATAHYADYTDRVVANAAALAAALAEHGIRPITGGTDTHLSLHDLQAVGVTGAQAEARCDAAGIVLNKNAIPFDPQRPNVASGIRVGTPSVTTQGMDEADMVRIAGLIARAITEGDPDPEHANSRAVRAEVADLVAAHPAYPR